MFLSSIKYFSGYLISAYSLQLIEDTKIKSDTDAILAPHGTADF
jgi:hypothetical protein